MVPLSSEAVIYANWLPNSVWLKTEVISRLAADHSGQRYELYSFQELITDVVCGYGSENASNNLSNILILLNDIGS